MAGKGLALEDQCSTAKWLSVRIVYGSRGTYFLILEDGLNMVKAVSKDAKLR